jgi:hypothetical protein
MPLAKDDPTVAKPKLTPKPTPKTRDHPAFAGGVLDPEVHDRLVADIDRFAADANITPEWAGLTPRSFANPQDTGPGRLPVVLGEAPPGALQDRPQGRVVGPSMPSCPGATSGASRASCASPRPGAGSLGRSGTSGSRSSPSTSSTTP